MADTTLEEAKRCPKCTEPGEFTGEQRLQNARMVTRGAKLQKFTCRNARCKWFNETWIVQVNPDGTIPPPTLRREKQFRPLGVSTEEITAMAQRIADADTVRGAEFYR